jgi:polysaccharide biosynthesis transport protein
MAAPVNAMLAATPALDDGLNAAEAPPPTLAERLQAISRRRVPALLVLVLALLATLAITFGLPAVYRSTATILIKEQEIPPELVRSTVTSFADERIQVITQQVMTRSTLLAMVDRHGLYGRARERETSEEIIDRMRRDIRIVPISAEVTDRRTGQPSRATIAFSVGYDSESAAHAQKVANELVTLFLNENLKNRQQKAAETTSFLDEERARLAARVSELEQKLAAFKRRWPDRLPEMALSNRIGSERLLAELQRLDRDIGFLDDRRIALQAQLADTKPTSAVPGNVGGPLEPEDRLRTLQVQLISLQGLYSDDHPDVRRLKREIASFKQETKLQYAAADREAQLAELRQSLASLRQRYSEEHPDVVKLKRVYAAIETAVRVGGEPGVTQPNVSAPRKPDNPAYLNLQQQVQATLSQLAALRAEREAGRLKLAQTDARVAQAPEVEREWLELSRDLEAARLRLRELADKQLQAEVAEQLERSRKAERFALIEPPTWPERPFKPNRPAVGAIGVVLSILLALAAVALAEALDPTVRHERDLTRRLPAPLLAVLPQAMDAGLPFRRRGWWAGAEAGAAARASRRRWAALLGGLTVLALAGAFHAIVMPLDVAWFGLLRRLGG